MVGRGAHPRPTAEFRVDFARRHLPPTLLSHADSAPGSRSASAPSRAPPKGHAGVVSGHRGPVKLMWDVVPVESRFVV